MVDSLRDQLLKSGIVKSVHREPRPAAAAAGTPARKKGKSQRAPRRSAAAGEMDLAKAYALRAQTQARERRQLEQELAEQARLRRERKAKIQQLLAGNTLNKADADQPRNFEYAGKIRRVYVDAAQLLALNAGQLGVVQQGGRYLLVTGDVARQVQAIDPHHLALLVDPAEVKAAADDGVPDDLMW
jgi:uncharacterized protein YaiL (DUF2058 family)